MAITLPPIKRDIDTESVSSNASRKSNDLSIDSKLVFQPNKTDMYIDKTSVEINKKLNLLEEKETLDDAAIEQKFLKLRSDWESKHKEYIEARDTFKLSQQKLLKETEKLLALNNSNRSSSSFNEPQKNEHVKLSLELNDNSDSESDSSSAISLTTKPISKKIAKVINDMDSD